MPRHVRFSKFTPLLTVLLSLACAAAGRAADAEDPVPTPAQLWERFQASQEPFTYRVVKDEIVLSESDPGKKLRRVEVLFSSQKVPLPKPGGDGTEWIMKDLWHPGVIFIPAGAASSSAPERRGRVVVVGGIGGPFRQSFLSNYGDPIAAETGYPTMVLPNPGETDDAPGREYSQWLLIQYRKSRLDPVHHSHFRWAVSFLRALDVLAGVLEIDPREIRAVIGGHSKRATSAFTAAAVDPDRIAGVVFMGNESLHPEDASSPWWPVSPYYAQRFVRCPVLYIGGTNENGYEMFNINRIQEHMRRPWAVEYIPNHRHESESEIQFLDWKMWTAHVFDRRPLTKISGLRFEETAEGTRFIARIDSPNTLILVRLWYVYCDDVPYWRDLVWYPSLMEKKEGNLFQGFVPGLIPDAWLVEVLDTAGGFRGYLSSLPMDITGKPTEVRHGQGMPRLWEEKKRP